MTKNIVCTLADAGVDIELLEPQLLEQSAAYYREIDVVPALANGACVPAAAPCEQPFGAAGRA